MIDNAVPINYPFTGFTNMLHRLRKPACTVHNAGPATAPPPVDTRERQSSTCVYHSSKSSTSSFDFAECEVARAAMLSETVSQISNVLLITVARSNLHCDGSINLASEEFRYALHIVCSL